MEIGLLKKWLILKGTLYNWAPNPIWLMPLQKSKVDRETRDAQGKSLWRHRGEGSSLLAKALLTKNIHKPKSWAIFYSVVIFRTSSPGISSQWNQNCSQEAKRAVRTIRILHQRTGCYIFLIKENQICQVKEFSSMCGKMQDTGLTEIVPY